MTKTEKINELSKLWVEFRNFMSDNTGNSVSIIYTKEKGYAMIVDLDKITDDTN
jgi:hypothetical protein